MSGSALAMHGRRWLARPRWWGRAAASRPASPQHELVQALFQGAEAGIAVIDRDGRIVRVNDALRRMVDRACGLAAGDPLATVFAIGRQQEAWDELAPVLQGRPLRGFVAALRGKSDGKPAQADQSVRVTAVGIPGLNGGVDGAVVFLADVSAQVRMEAQLTHGQKLQAVGQLAGGIAHDFNNLLTAVIGAADEIIARTPADGETLEDAEQIRASAERGSSLVKQLLAFGRQQTLQPRVIGINGAVRGTSGLLKRLLGSKVRLQLELEEPGCMICVDPTQLDQVLVNLAVNARDAMPEGGVLTLRSGHVTLFRALPRGEELIPPGRYAMLEVQDTGVGIPADVLPRIFDPFFTTRRERGGSGLGLSTVHGVVRQSDGFLAVDSSVGKGTRIRVYLPRHDGEAVAIPHVPPPVAATVQPAASRLVLLVDDEDSIRRLGVRALTNKGWSVLDADSAEAALALVRDPSVLHQVCAVVSDVVMPGMDGVALMRELRRRRPGLPVILASGYAEEAVRADIEGNDDLVFLPKPYPLRLMVETVGRIALFVDLAAEGKHLDKLDFAAEF